jgi:streptogramin lyase
MGPLSGCGAVRRAVLGGTALVCTVTLFLVSGATASEVTEYSAGLSAGTHPNVISPGPDGAMWFTEWDGSRLGRIATDGQITEFPPASSPGLSAGAHPSGIVAGPDGNLWFTEFSGNAVGALDPATGQLLGEWTIPVGTHPDGIAVGSDGALWVALNGPGGNTTPQIARVVPVAGAAPTITTYTLFGDPTSAYAPVSLVNGPDGNLWVTDAIGGVWRVDPARIVNNPSYSPDFFALPGLINSGSSSPAGITVDQAGRFLWVALSGKSELAQIDPTQVSAATNAGIRYYSLNGAPLLIAAPGDGAIWTTDHAAHQLERFDETLQTTSILAGGQGVTGDPNGAAPDAAGNLWFTEFSSGLVGEVAFASENRGVPVITGTPSAGQTLTCSTGAWSPQPTAFAYAWARDGTAINGATAAQYGASPADVGHTLTCTVTATLSGAGAASATSSGVLGGDALPVNSPPPTITGEVADGVSVSCATGGWSNNPTAFAYQWFLDGAPIAGATAQTYTIPATAYERLLSCAVSAFNGTGAATALSASVRVDHQAPTNTIGPSITGVARVGRLLTCDPGQWTHDPALSFSWTWRQPTNFAVARSGKIIGVRHLRRLRPFRSAESAGIGSTETITIPDVPATGYSSLNLNHTGPSQLICTVTATSGSHVVTATTQVAMIAEVPVLATHLRLVHQHGYQVVFAPPHIDPTVGYPGRNLCTPGTWSHFPTAYTYGWYTQHTARSHRKVIKLLKLLTTGREFDPLPGDEGERVVCVVTARNAAGITTAMSNLYVVPATAPQNRTIPSVYIQTQSPNGTGTAVTSGEAIAEQATFSCEQGTWNRTDVHFSWAWYLVDVGNPNGNLDLGVASNVPYNGNVLSLNMRPGHLQYDVTVECVVTATTNNGKSSQITSGPIHVWDGCFEATGTAQGGPDFSNLVAEAGVGALAGPIGSALVVGYFEGFFRLFGYDQDAGSDQTIMYTAGPNCLDYQHYWEGKGYTVKQTS